MCSSDIVYISASPQLVSIHLHLPPILSSFVSEFKETGLSPTTTMASAANQLSNALNELTMYEELNEPGFPFLRLPVELRMKIVDILSQYPNLRALRLVCKHLSDLATPCLYSRVDLSTSDDFKANRRLQRMGPRAKASRLPRRIRALLLNLANLQFVKVLKIGQCGTRSTSLMDQLLPLLRKDSLTKFSYSTQSVHHFPTPLQMQLLWGSQKHLKNLKLYSHMVPALEAFLKEHQSSQSLFLKSFTKVDLSDDWGGCNTNTPTSISWPLKNLDSSHLKSLSINGNGQSSDTGSTLNSAFTDGTFVNLTNLSFKRIRFARTLTLTNVPLLKSLLIEQCEPSQVSTPPLALADNLRLKSLTYRDNGRLDELAPLLAQIQGLECLFIKPLVPGYRVNLRILGLVRAVLVHGETLRVFKLKVDLRYAGDTQRSHWEAEFVKNIQLCDKLVDLSLPIFSKKPTSYFRDLITSFPHVTSLTIYTGIQSFYYWSPSDALGLFPASTQLESVLFKGPLLDPDVFDRHRAQMESGPFRRPRIYPDNSGSHQTQLESVRFKSHRMNPDNLGWHRRCFVRKELEQLCRP